MLVPRRIVAAMVVLFFGHLAAYPQDYTSGTYTVLRELAALRWWGLALLAAGFWMLVSRGPAATIATGVLLFGWAGGLLAAVVTGDSQSPAGSVWILGVACLLVWGAGRAAPRT